MVKVRDLWSRWSPPDKEVFHIPGLSPAMMQLIIEFALPNGILLAIGGWSGTDPTNSIESYDVSTDLWMQVTDQDVGLTFPLISGAD
ncbi:uncharacterized protein PEZ65_020987 [Lycodopsis pacificus]